MRGLDRGEEYVVTRNGVAVGALAPLQRRRFVAAEAALAAFTTAGPVDAERLRADLDAVLDQDAGPRE